MQVIRVSCALVVLAVASSSFGFKPKTHIWVAQQVLNDVADGCRLEGAANCVTIVLCVNRVGDTVHAWTPDAPCREHEYRVDPELAQALLGNPGAYRAGHIGPDAFPDFVVGQTTAHPGIDGGWSTDDWLQWMFDGRGEGNAERAFAYGYLGHAAGDMFAHTYVNTYAGDIFVLTDGETTIERRHYALEDFIDHYTPPIVGHDKRPIATNDLLRIPSSFVAQRLILSKDALRQYRDPKAFAPHLVAMRGVLQSLEDAIGATNFAKVESTFLDQTRELETRIEKLVLEIDALASPIEKARADVERAKAPLQAYDDRLAAKQKFVKQAAEAIEKLIDEKKKAKEFLDGFEKQKDSLEDRLDEAQGQLEAIVDKVGKEAAKLDPRVKEIKEKLDEAKDDLDDLKDRAERSRGTVKNFPSAEAEKKRVRAAAELEIRRIEAERRADQGAQKALDLATRTLEGLETHRRELMQRVAALHSNVDHLLGPLGEVRKIRAFLESWRADLLNATEAYADAGLDAGLAFVVRTDPLKPYQSWMACWSPAYTGLPSQGSRSGCAIARSIDELRALISRTRKDIRDAFGETGGWAVDPLGKLEEEITKEVEPAVRKAAIDLVGVIGGREWKAFAKIVGEKFDAKRLDELYAKDESNKNLLLISGISSRARTDMGVTKNKKKKESPFNPDAFAAAYDAVVMSKLTLLDRHELNRLIADSGWWPPSAWHRELLYDASAKQNILLGVLNSIDGDHAWNYVAPLRPRRGGNVDSSRPRDRDYGKAHPLGLRLWLSCKARKLTFLGLLRGPLNPGINDLLPDGYRYRATREDPFPAIAGTDPCRD